MTEAKTFLPDLKKHFKFSEDEVKAATKPDTRNGMKWIGGEKAAIERLDKFIKKSIKKYSETRNNLLGDAYSSKLSPWISNGSLSIRKVYWSICPTKDEKLLAFID